MSHLSDVWFRTTDLEIVSGSGCTVRTADGTEYLDFTAGIAVVSTGHSHPRVVAAIERWFAGLDPAQHSFAIADIPLLFETGREKDYDSVIVTACDPDLQVRRLMARDGIGDAEARQRIAASIAGTLAMAALVAGAMVR